LGDFQAIVLCQRSQHGVYFITMPINLFFGRVETASKNAWYGSSSVTNIVFAAASVSVVTAMRPAQAASATSLFYTMSTASTLYRTQLFPLLESRFFGFGIVAFAEGCVILLVNIEMKKS
jgi:hypothetical protein